MAKSVKKSVSKSLKNKSRRTKNRFSRKVGKRRNGGGGERKTVRGEISLNKEEILLNEINELEKEKNELEGLNNTEIKNQIIQTTKIRHPNSSDIEIQKMKNEERIQDITKEIKRLEAVHDDKSLTKKIDVKDIPAYRADDTVMILPEFTPEEQREIENFIFWQRFRGQRIDNKIAEVLSYMGFKI